MKSVKIIIRSVLISLSFLSLNSCIPLAVGAAGGYILNEEGYEVQSPIKRD